MEHVARLFANNLLQISAVNLQPDNCFIWGNGWNAPLYTDMRKLLSYPRIRTFVKIELSRLIEEQFPEVEAIAGVATGAIAISTLVADELNLPYAYVRTKPKDHGLENLIEGNLKPGLKVVIVNDLLTNGARTRRVAEAVKDAGCEVIGMVALLDFDFEAGASVLADMDIPVKSLCHYDGLLDVAIESGLILPADMAVFRAWHEDPENWIPDNILDHE
ncbi:MAG: orotate phosphoribosyltransferase [Muribaculaceae bacterium]|nr:orotate phosphoribosyltransferase [Muribaculaceae bacterium]